MPMIAKVDGIADRITRTHIAKTLVEKKDCEPPATGFR